VPTPRSRWAIWLTALIAVIVLAVGGYFIHRVERTRFEERERRLEANMANFQAFFLDSQGRGTEAESLFLRAIDLDPAVAKYWRDLADYYYKHGEYAKAIRYYRQTIDLDPSDVTSGERLVECQKLTEEGAESDAGEAGL
jgi:tetratricopeptide (TPR) repeat protein